MATPQEINISNFASLLVLSSEGRAGTPDGNIYFDQDHPDGIRIELITREELPQVDLGSGLEDNPLTNFFGITMRALYNFENQARSTTQTLRGFDIGTGGRFFPAGAYEFINGAKLSADVNSSTGDDRTKIRGSGFAERAENNALDRVYFAPRSLNNIEATSQVYVQIAASLSESDLQAAAPTNAARLGPLNEVFQVFGTTANGDAGAGDFDSRSDVLVARVRTFGFTQGVATSAGSGVTEMAGFSSGFGLGEAPSPSAGFDLADVYGGAAIAPFTGLGFFRHDTPQTRTGFTEADGDFTDEITNTQGASLAQIRAWLDAVSAQDTDENDNTGATGPFRPARAEELYTINSEGLLVTRQGLFIAGVPAADNQGIIQTADNGDTKTYPFSNVVRVAVSDAWFDAGGWYDCYFEDGAGGQDYSTANAVRVNDASGSPVVGNSGDARSTGGAGSRIVEFTFDYSGNNQAGLSPGTDKQVRFIVAAPGGAVETSILIDIVSQAIITASAQAPAETN